MRLELEYKLEQEKIQAQKDETERLERIRREEAAIKNRQAEFSALEQKLSELLPFVHEANMLSQELQRKIKFNVKMQRVMPEFGTIMEGKTEVAIRVENEEDNYYYIWTPEKFMDRLYMMRENLNEFFETGELPDFNDQDNDAFWDPPEPLCIGTSYLSLKMLGYTLENELEAKILSSEGASGARGEISVKYWPCDEEGTGEPSDDLIVDEPKELLGKEIYFRVEIDKACDLPRELCKNVFVTYQFKHEPNQIYSTPE